VLRHIEIVRNLADGPKCVGGLFQNRLAPTG
jgi:hypothetical protein